MSLTKPLHAALVFALTFASGAALAAEATTSASQPAPQARSFAALDSNRDGELSFSEAFAHPKLGNAFNILDTNADGVLSRSEVAAIVR
jgi:Ca2+-binding EF-hand superfamily protein